MDWKRQLHERDLCQIHDMLLARQENDELNDSFEAPILDTTTPSGDWKLFDRNYLTFLRWKRDKVLLSYKNFLRQIYISMEEIFNMYVRIQNKGREKKMVKMIGCFHPHPGGGGGGVGSGGHGEQQDHDHSQEDHHGGHGHGHDDGGHDDGDHHQDLMPELDKEDLSIHKHGKYAISQGKRRFQEKLDRLEKLLQKRRNTVVRNRRIAKLDLREQLKPFQEGNEITIEVKKSRSPESYSPDKTGQSLQQSMSQYSQYQTPSMVDRDRRNMPMASLPPIHQAQGRDRGNRFLQPPQKSLTAPDMKNQLMAPILMDPDDQDYSEGRDRGTFKEFNPTTSSSSETPSDQSNIRDGRRGQTTTDPSQQLGQFETPYQGTNQEILMTPQRGTTKAGILRYGYDETGSSKKNPLNISTIQKNTSNKKKIYKEQSQRSISLSEEQIEMDHEIYQKDEEVQILKEQMKILRESLKLRYEQIKPKIQLKNNYLGLTQSPNQNPDSNMKKKVTFNFIDKPKIDIQPTSMKNDENAKEEEISPSYQSSKKVEYNSPSISSGFSTEKSVDSGSGSNSENSNDDLSGDSEKKRETLRKSLTLEQIFKK